MVAMHSKWHQTGNSLTLRKRRTRDETTQAGSVLTGCRRDCLTVEEHGSKAAWQQSSCATRDPDPCPQIVRLYAKASEPRMERK
jgi:hypothetical protein